MKKDRFIWLLLAGFISKISQAHKWSSEGQRLSTSLLVKLVGQVPIKVKIVKEQKNLLTY